MLKAVGVLLGFVAAASGASFERTASPKKANPGAFGTSRAPPGDGRLAGGGEDQDRDEDRGDDAPLLPDGCSRHASGPWPEGRGPGACAWRVLAAVGRCGIGLAELAKRAVCCILPRNGQDSHHISSDNESAISDDQSALSDDLSAMSGDNSPLRGDDQVGVCLVFWDWGTELVQRSVDIAKVFACQIHAWATRPRIDLRGYRRRARRTCHCVFVTLAIGLVVCSSLPGLAGPDSRTQPCRLSEARVLELQDTLALGRQPLEELARMCSACKKQGPLKDAGDSGMDEVPVEQESKPEAGGRVHFSGTLLGDKTVSGHISEAFGADDYGEYVGVGAYAENRNAFPKAIQYTFDAVAVDAGTRVIIYSEPHFKGQVLWDKTGPAIVVNSRWRDDARNKNLLSGSWKEPLDSIFPREVREWSATDMHTWASGSTRIEGGQPIAPEQLAALPDEYKDAGSHCDAQVLCDLVQELADTMARGERQAAGLFGCGERPDA